MVFFRPMATKYLNEDLIHLTDDGVFLVALKHVIKEGRNTDVAQIFYFGTSGLKLFITLFVL